MEDLFPLVLDDLLRLESLGEMRGLSLHKAKERRQPTSPTNPPRWSATAPTGTTRAMGRKAQAADYGVTKTGLQSYYAGGLASADPPVSIFCDTLARFTAMIYRSHH